MTLRVLAILAAFVVVPSTLSGSADAQERRLPSSATEMKLSFAPAVQRAAPAVVNVYAAKAESRNPFFDDPLFRRFFGVAGILRKKVQRTLRSGVIADAARLV